MKILSAFRSWNERIMIRRLCRSCFHEHEFDFEKKTIYVPDFSKRFLQITRAEAIALDRLMDWYGWTMLPFTRHEILNDL